MALNPVALMAAKKRKKKKKDEENIENTQPSTYSEAAARKMKNIKPSSYSS